MKIILGLLGLGLSLCGAVYAQSRSFSTDYIGHNVFWNGTNWVSTGAGYGSVIGPSSGTGDVSFYTTGNAASGGLTRTLTQAAAITPAGTVSATAMQAYTGSFGNVNATGTISATTLKVNDLDVTNLTVNGSSYSGGGGGGTSATMVAGWPDALFCSGTEGSMILWNDHVVTSTGIHYYTYNIDTGHNVAFTSTGAPSSASTAANYNTSCRNKSIAQLYASGQAFNFVGNGGANGENGYDNIVSGSTKITANSTGYISLTTGGTTTGYFTTTGGLVVPTVSTTGAISGTRGYFTQDLGVGRPIESWMLSNTIVTKGQVIADAGVNISGGTGYSWEDGHVSVASNDGTDVEMRTNYVARLKIISNGNVGINTIDPNATLDVHGTISATALTVNGAAVNAGGNNLTAATAIATTSGTAALFTGIPASARRVTIMLSGVSTNGSSLLRIQLGTSGGVETTGYKGATSDIVAAAGYGTTLYSSGFDIPIYNTATFSENGNVICTKLTGYTWTCSGVLGQSDANVTAYLGGSKTLSADLDRIKFTTINGTDTFDAGTVNIMWE